MNSKTYGKVSEILAVKYLKQKKYKILETNFTTKCGEIDVIAMYKKLIIFIEIKARHTQKFGAPREAVTLYKQNKIRTVAQEYLIVNNLTQNYIRFDVIEINNDEIIHLENCF